MFKTAPPPPNKFQLKQQVIVGHKIAEPTGPFTKEGYTFKHWSANKSGTPKYDFTTPVKKNLTLYAIWAEKEQNCTVTFELQGGTAPNGFEAARKVKKGTAVSQPQGVFKKDEHTFKHWSLNENGDPQYDFKTPVTEDIKLYAYWEKIPDNKFVVTLDYNDGTTPAKTEYIDKNTPFAKPTDPARAGYKFLHWQKESETQAYDFTQPVAANLTLIAQWEKEPWKVTFFFEGGKNAQGADKEIIDVKDGEKVTEPQNITKDGAKFSHWGKKATTQKEHAFDFGIPITENLELHAVWITLYTVTFDPDGGTVASGTLPQPQQIEEGGTVSKSLVEGLKLKKQGLVGKQWSKDGSKPFGFDRTRVKEDITLKPIWIDENVTVTLCYNYTGAPADKQIKIERDTVFAQPSQDLPKRDGYVIVEWKGKKKNGEFYKNPYDFRKPVKNDLTLYAIWGKSEVTVTFNWNYDGAAAPHTQKLASGASVAQPSNIPTRAGYKLDHWSKNENGKPEYSFGEPLTDDLYLYAHWVNEYTVKFDLNQGTGTVPAEQKVLSNDRVQEPTAEANNALKRDGFYFKHWTDDITANTPYNFSKNKVTKNLTLFAVWGKLSTVTFYPNGVQDVQNLPASKKQKPGEHIAKPTPDPTATGYTFKFWSQNRNAEPTAETEAFKFDTETIAEDTDVSLYAIWQPENGAAQQSKKWTVKFDLNGAPAQANTDAYKDQIVTDNTILTTPSQSPVWDGYEFRHWSEASSGTAAETAYTIASTPVTKDMTLYAIWKLIPKKHTVQFDLNNGTGTKPADQQIEHGQKVTKPTDEEVKKMTAPEGQEFSHWSLTKEAGSAKYNFEQETVTGAITLYAIWMKKDFDVVLVIDDYDTKEVVTAKYGDTADKLKTPGDFGHRIEHYEFSHWSKEKNGTKYTDPIKEALTLYAVWKQIDWLVTFNLNGGSFKGESGNLEEYVAKNGKVTEPDKTLLKKSGHSFKHWENKQQSGTPYNFESPVTGNIELVAIWDTLSAADAYTITFMHGDKEIKKVLVPKNTAESSAMLGDAGIPTTIDGLEDGKAFGYWTKDKDWATDTKKGWFYDFRDVVTSDIILYALIFDSAPDSVKPFLIDLDGGTISDDSVKTELLGLMRKGFKKNTSINLKSLKGKESTITKGGKKISKWRKNTTDKEVTVGTTIQKADFNKTPKNEPKNAVVLTAVYK
ncbi:MAG: InlB B-repeat-containing protein [Treponema sp.]